MRWPQMCAFAKSHLMRHRIIFRRFKIYCDEFRLHGIKSESGAFGKRFEMKV